MVWDATREEVVAPMLLRYELVNAVHRHGRALGLSAAETQEMLATAFARPITLYTVFVDHQRALELAAQLNRPATYDAHYLALAERLGVEFWTADERLYNAVRHALPWVRLVA
jgi:predicted nucleic acid-binding protein